MFIVIIVLWIKERSLLSSVSTCQLPLIVNLDIHVLLHHLQHQFALWYAALLVSLLASSQAHTHSIHIKDLYASCFKMWLANINQYLALSSLHYNVGELHAHN